MWLHVSMVRFYNQGKNLKYSAKTKKVTIVSMSIQQKIYIYRRLFNALKLENTKITEGKYRLEIHGSGKVISPWILLMCVDILIFISSFYVLLICVVSHDCSGLSLAVGFLCYLDTPKLTLRYI